MDRGPGELSQQTLDHAHPGQRLTLDEVKDILRAYDELDRSEAEDHPLRVALAAVVEVVPPFETSEFYAGMLQGLIIQQAAAFKYLPFVTTEYMNFTTLVNRAVARHLRDALVMEGKLDG